MATPSEPTETQLIPPAMTAGHPTIRKTPIRTSQAEAATRFPAAMPLEEKAARESESTGARAARATASAPAAKAARQRIALASTRTSRGARAAAAENTAAAAPAVRVPAGEPGATA